MDDTTSKETKIEQLVKLLAKSPNVAVWAVLIAGAGCIYSDNREFIKEQNETLKSINTTQIQMQVELRELNTRMSELEHKLTH